jgi:hypothetical protein
MGNHDVGTAMSTGAAVFWLVNVGTPVDKEKALQVLDVLAGTYRGADAEFDDHTQPDKPLGKLMAIAFGPWDPGDLKKGSYEYWVKWDEEIWGPFSQRYEFC